MLIADILVRAVEERRGSASRILLNEDKNERETESRNWLFQGLKNITFIVKARHALVGVAKPSSQMARNNGSGVWVTIAAQRGRQASRKRASYRPSTCTAVPKILWVLNA